MRRLLRLTALVVLLAAVAVVVPAGAAQDDDSPLVFLDKYGWWSKAQQLPGFGGVVPAPPGSPPDGLYVAYDGVTPDEGGTLAIGAVGFDVPEGASTRLVLTFDGSAPTGTLLACPTKSDWGPAQNGPWSARPAYDCAAAATGKIAGTTVTFDLDSSLLVRPTALEVAIVPSGTTPFQASLKPPTDESLTVTGASLGDDAITGDDSAFAGSDSSSTAFDASGSLAAGDAGTFAFGTFDDATVSPPAVAAPQTRTGRGAVAAPAGNVVPSVFRDTSRGQRLMAFAVLLLMAAALWWIGGQPVRAPRLLGSIGGGGTVAATAGVSPRGIGRFARPRTVEEPPRLL